MAQGLVWKGALLVVFVGALAGATYGVQSYLGGEGAVAAAGQVALDAPRSLLNATPGHDVSFIVRMQNHGAQPATLVAHVQGDGVDARSRPTLVPPGEARAVFVTLTVPQGEGIRMLDLRAETPTGEVLREREDHLRLRILPPARGLERGDTGVLLYTGRIAESGRVFNSNDPFLLRLAFETTDEYRPNDRLLEVETDPPTVVPGFLAGMMGMQPGESRTFEVAPADAYGNETELRELGRTERVPRVFELPVTVETIERRQFDQFVSQSGQGNASAFRAGDIFYDDQGGNRWPYEVVSISASEVAYRIAVQEGERYTLPFHAFWTNASLVRSVNSTHVVFFTTPTTAPGTPFTMRSYWPQMSAVERMDDESVLVRHSPPVGYKFTLPSTREEPSRDATVAELRDDAIVLSLRNVHPLAGRVLVFDVQLLEIRR